MSLIGDRQHGTNSAHRGGCHCTFCVLANRDYQRGRYQELDKTKLQIYQKTHYAKRTALIRGVKTQRGGCMDCGYNDNPVALDFDHRNPDEKLFAIGAGRNRSLDTLFLEMAKCDVRCANCHRIKTYNMET